MKYYQVFKNRINNPQYEIEYNGEKFTFYLFNIHYDIAQLKKDIRDIMLQTFYYPPFKEKIKHVLAKKEFILQRLSDAETSLRSLVSNLRNEIIQDYLKCQLFDELYNEEELQSRLTEWLRFSEHVLPREISEIDNVYGWGMELIDLSEYLDSQIKSAMNSPLYLCSEGSCTQKDKPPVKEGCEEYGVNNQTSKTLDLNKCIDFKTDNQTRLRREPDYQIAKPNYGVARFFDNSFKNVTRGIVAGAGFLLEAPVSSNSRTLAPSKPSNDNDIDLKILIPFLAGAAILVVILFTMFCKLSSSRYNDYVANDEEDVENGIRNKF